MGHVLAPYWAVKHRRPADYSFFKALNPPVVKKWVTPMWLSPEVEAWYNKATSIDSRGAASTAPGLGNSVGGAATMSHHTPDAPRVKVCPSCGETKPLTEYLLRKSGPKVGRPRGACKECARAAHARFRAANPDKDAAYKRDRRVQYAAYERARRAKDNAAYNQKARVYQSTRPDRIAAVNAVNNAVVAGRLPHVSTLTCVGCGEQAQQYHHHKGYAIEHRMDVVPMCRLCHERAHHHATEVTL